MEKGQWFLDGSSNPIPLTFKSVGIYVAPNIFDSLKYNIRLIFSTATGYNIETKPIYVNPVHIDSSAIYYGFVIETDGSAIDTTPGSMIDITPITKVFPIFLMSGCSPMGDCFLPKSVLFGEETKYCVFEFMNGSQNLIVGSLLSYNLVQKELCPKGLSWSILLTIILIIVIFLVLTIDKNVKGRDLLLKNRNKYLNI